jgi:hypothetical protein
LPALPDVPVVRYDRIAGSLKKKEQLSRRAN